MISSLYAKLIGLGLVLALIASAGAYIHHKGAASQKAVDGKVIAALNVQIAGYKAQEASTAIALQKINAAADAAKADAAVQKSYADAAFAQLAADQQARVANEAKRATVVAHAATTPACDTKLSAKVCADLATGY